MRPIMTAAAALVLVTGAAHAQGNGHGNGNGNDRGGGPSMKGNAKGTAPGKGNAGHGGDQARAAPMQGAGSKDRGNDKAETRVQARVQPGDAGVRGNGNANLRVADDRMRAKPQRVPERVVANRPVVVDRNRNDNNDRFVVVDRGRDANLVRVANYRAVPSRGFIAGCPPGLAKKNPPCIPPGQVRTRVVRYDRPDFWGLRQVDTRYRYRYDDGYLLRLDGNGRTGGYIPLLGGALRVGNPWPTYYQPVALPTYYESYYGIGPYNSYRYADNVIYRVNPETAAITSVAALLTGDDFTVGQPMPLGYDVYNVPYGYRTQYVDSPSAMYRYSDGYVYQIDPTTRLVAAAIELALS